MSALGKPRLASGRRDPPWRHMQAALDKARGRLLALQKPDGHWCGELEGDSILESEYVLLMAFLGREGEARVRKATNYLLTKQHAGGWSIYPGGPIELSASVKAYFALKLTGHDPQAAYMREARAAILARGGAEGCNSFTKFYLAFLGQLSYANCASVPPELLFLPRWAYINMYAMSSWTRTILVPLSIFSSFKPVRALPPERGIRELFRHDPHRKQWPHPPTRRCFTASNLFLLLDQLIKRLEVVGPQRVRQVAVAKASAWMREHFEESDGVGAIFPPIIYTIIALHCLGYANDSPEMTYALQQLDDLMIEDADTLRIQPCFSPVWDTALALNALALSGGQQASAAMARASQWLYSKEVRRPGDWSIKNPRLEAGGWFFEYRNEFYPDVDDTAMVLMGLARSGCAWKEADEAIAGRTREVRVDGPHEAHAPHRPLESRPALPPKGGTPAVERGLRWLLAMQNSDGGWAAFDRDINRELLTQVPFADHNAMLDPSCPDITARVLEALAEYGYGTEDACVKRALAFIERRQDARGCWFGRWGVNYIYGTWQVLIGLKAIGYDMDSPPVRKAVSWLKKVQQDCGGWGESCASYDDPRTAGQGVPTASQTAWALLGLIAAGEADSAAVADGIAYLMRTQQADGNWNEEEFTGTGFPKVFYLKYHLYRLYFPLMALARYCQAMTQTTGEVIKLPAAA